MQEIKSVRDAEVAGKRVLVRIDCDVPVKNAKVENDFRLRAAIPTLELLHERGAAQITLISHRGRPGGKRDGEFSLAPVEARLHELTHVPFELKENLRYNPGEEANDPAFAQELAALGDVYINEAFGDSHRVHASIVGIPKLLPSYAGLRFETEVQKLSEALTPPGGSLAIIGGVKFETKEPLLKKLLSLYKEVLLGGALANDIIRARGWPIGESVTSGAGIPEDLAGEDRLVVPTDAIFKEPGGNAERSGLVVDTRAGERIVDLGPLGAKLWAQKILAAPFVLWNGPMGVYEDGFVDGTNALAEALSKFVGRAVVGGGDTVAAVSKFTFDPAKIFFSVGGGAMLEFLTHGTLPGIEVLKQ